MKLPNNFLKKVKESKRQSREKGLKRKESEKLARDQEKRREEIREANEKGTKNILKGKRQARDALFEEARRNCVNYFQKMVEPPMSFIYGVQEELKTIKALTNDGAEISLDKSLLPTCDSGAQYLGGTSVDQYMGAQMIQVGSFNPVMTNWYMSQGFIPYQLSAIYSQHWLIHKGCKMPADDCVRNGINYTINTTEGTDDGDTDETTQGGRYDNKDEIIRKIRRCEKEYAIKENLREFVTKGRLFGVRIAVFLVDSDDPDYYEKPFDPDSIKPGTFRGITQIDPYWIVPQLSLEAATDPTDKNFYEPTWWTVPTVNLNKLNHRGMVRVHRSHVCVFRYAEVADMLKPAYIYGAMSLPQHMAQRVYASEKIANEAPMLALCKRSYIYKMKIAEAYQDEGNLGQKLTNWGELMNNFGIMAIDLDEEISQLDTSLSDFTDLMNGQWYLNSAISGIPITKLFGTSPPGFQSTGEFEMKTYHENLGTIAEKHLIPFLEKFLIYIIKSEINPYRSKKLDIYDVDIAFAPFDIPGAQEVANIRKTEAETDMLRLQAFTVTRQEVRKKLAEDQNSGYNGIDVSIDPEKVDGGADYQAPDEDGTGEEQEPSGDFLDD